ncbi:hypothetical protein RHMOL_Rhmol01G0172500 [Rhododendron molle]|uniref:Uncharacterized protein n=1 Tax=Rhododendron molle TaxID=49168 RepID=A0ACC0Q2B3_RHOML|nr:hypothetical protein RHMOL_Rhmol01G0172500 [Rhododendron molle]
MTITPGDFALLTGLRVGGDPLPIDRRIHEREGALSYLLGKVPELPASGHITYSWLREQFDRAGIESKLWALEHLLQFPPPTRHREPRFIPRAARWLKGVRKTRSPAMDLLAWRRVLDRLTVGQDTLLDDAPLELTSARALDSQHFLLEGPFSRAWYLGERVVSQYFPYSEALQLVPVPPPTGMKSNHLLTGEGLLLTLERQVAMGFLVAGDYSAFHLASLTLPTATTAAAPSVWPLAPNFFSFHNANGEEERLMQTPCATQFYKLPTGVQQVPADVVQEWLRAFQSAEALARRQRSRIVALEVERVPMVSVTQSAGVSEAGSTRAGDGDVGDDDEGEGQRINVPVPECFLPAPKRGRG